MSPATQGTTSGRAFDPGAAGGPIRKLSFEDERITPRAIVVVEQHLRRFTEGGSLGDFEQAMLDLLHAVSDETLEPTGFDRRFYTHELREFVRFRALGFKLGLPADADESYDLWNNAHTAALEDYGINEVSSPLYHPSVMP